MENIHIKHLYFKAKRRGTIELDLVLGYIADTYLPTMSEENKKLFAQLLEVDDKLLMQWIFYNQPVPMEYNNDIWQLIKTYSKTP